MELALLLLFMFCVIVPFLIGAFIRVGNPWGDDHED
jgi:hypothetical protein